MTSERKPSIIIGFTTSNLKILTQVETLFETNFSLATQDKVYRR